MSLCSREGTAENIEELAADDSVKKKRAPRKNQGEKENTKPKRKPRTTVDPADSEFDSDESH